MAAHHARQPFSHMWTVLPGSEAALIPHSQSDAALKAVLRSVVLGEPPQLVEVLRESQGRHGVLDPVSRDHLANAVVLSGAGHARSCQVAQVCPERGPVAPSKLGVDDHSGRRVRHGDARVHLNRGLRGELDAGRWNRGRTEGGRKRRPRSLLKSAGSLHAPGYGDKTNPDWTRIL